MNLDLQSNEKRKLVITANTGWYIYNFRIDLIKYLVSKNYDINIICPKDEYSFKLKNMGLNVYFWELNRKSINPFSELYSLFHLIKLYSKIKPEIVHHFTLKACLYGTLSANLFNKVSVINSITGIGPLFISKDIKLKLIYLFLKRIFRQVFSNLSKKVIFQNNHDRDKYIKLKLTTSNKSIVIPGSGINTDFFKPSNKETNINDFKLLFPSRIIKEKGIIELLQACKLLWEIKLPIKLFIAGKLDTGNRSVLKLKEFKRLKNLKNISLLGHVENMRDLYKQIDVVILPSWREGLSRSLLEAASMEKGIITTNVPGCREIVEHNKTGLVVNIKSPIELKESILRFYNNIILIKKYGKAARQKVIKSFDVNRINNLTINEYNKF
tara:strand:+ start:12377 stop:13525 length:1149 start_codon:yes stop_codon:yes gene_type:complete